MNNRFYSLLGLAAKAGKIASGSFRTEQEIKNGRACLVIMSDDIGQAVAEKLRDCSNAKNVVCITTGDRDSLSHAVGRDGRSCLAVTDEGFAAALLKLLSQDSAQ
ncbi:MAG: ribosomal L7Ae/L30e/S12e/Gadd45 family protein [Lachnospiraceae bacterium]|nr:ribosomal L7Ae/L30e/S12e/Gadd45 family protein [Lachnospiraceae bacterium]